MLRLSLRWSLLCLVAWTCAIPPLAAEDAVPQPVAPVVAKPTADEGPIPTALADYIALPDDSFAWKRLRTDKPTGGTVHTLELTSQTWQNITWKHMLLVYEPTSVQNPQHMLLFITGGSHLKEPKDSEKALGLTLAQLTGCRVATLHQVPNQPLFGDHVEDDLISETFLKYLATKDATWPLLFPMVKSAVRGMDALQQFSKEEFNADVTSFVVTGASKRGWTTWLTGVVDPRVKGIAPIVIDTLNLPKQMDYQLATWGKYSEQIDDYTRKGLVEHMQKNADVPLWRWVDPYTYRSQLALPKLIINGTNDRYWTVDALNNYWDDLPGTKHIRYVPNAGHNLKGGQEGALATLAAFTRHVGAGKNLPEIRWYHTDVGEQLQLEISTEKAPEAVRLWQAHSDTKDFRDAKWTATDLPLTGGLYNVKVARPATGHIAIYGEVQFSQGLLEYSVSTQIRRE